jgi:hypothetical protein
VLCVCECECVCVCVSFKHVHMWIYMSEHGCSYIYIYIYIYIGRDTLYIHAYLHPYTQARRIASSSSDSSENESPLKPHRSSHHSGNQNHHHLGGPANRSSTSHRSSRQHNTSHSHDVSIDLTHASMVKTSSPPHQHHPRVSSSRGGYVGKGEWKGSNSPSPDKIPASARGVCGLMERWGSPSGKENVRTRTEKGRQVSSTHSNDTSVSLNESPKDGSISARNSAAPFDRHVARDIVSPTRPQHGMYTHNHPAQGAMSPQNLTAKYGQRSPPLADGRRLTKEGTSTSTNVKAHVDHANAAQREVQRSAESRDVPAPPRHVVRELSLTPSASSHVAQPSPRTHNTSGNHNNNIINSAGQPSPRTSVVSSGVRTGTDNARVSDNKAAEELDGFIKGLTVRKCEECVSVVCTCACVCVCRTTRLQRSLIDLLRALRCVCVV